MSKDGVNIGTQTKWISPLHCRFVKCAINIMVVTAITLMLSACMSGKPNATNRYVDLVDRGLAGLDVLITREEWGGFWGPEGYIGFQTRDYRANLVGNGPVYTNPWFADDPPSIRCVGTITIDRERGVVMVNMRRVVSNTGERERTKAHPANGTYLIRSTRKGKDDKAR